MLVCKGLCCPILWGLGSSGGAQIWAPNRRHSGGPGLMTGSSRGKWVPGTGALLVMTLLLIPLAPALPATITPEMNGDGQGKAGSLSGSLKTERRKNSQPAFSLFSSKKWPSFSPIKPCSHPVMGKGRRIKRQNGGARAISITSVCARPPEHT